MSIVVPFAVSSAQAVGMTLAERTVHWEAEYLSLGAAGEPLPEAGSQVAPKTRPESKSGPLLIPQQRA